MFKNKIEIKPILLSNSVEANLYKKEMNKRGFNTIHIDHIPYNGYPTIAIPRQNKNIVVIDNGSFKAKPFYKMVKKSFVKKMIKAKNKRANFQKRFKRFKLQKNEEGIDILNQAKAKNKNILNSMHICIDFLFGKNFGKKLTTFEQRSIYRALKKVKS